MTTITKHARNRSKNKFRFEILRNKEGESFFFSKSQLESAGISRTKTFYKDHRRIVSET